MTTRPGQSLLSRLSFVNRENHASPNQGLPFAAKTVLSILKGLYAGHLTVVLPNGQVHEFGLLNDQPVAEIRIFDWNVFRRILRHGDIGFAEAYISGEWNTPDLLSLLELAVRNRNTLEKAIYGNWLVSFIYRVKHQLRRNTKVNSKKNIQAHYDLGNAFYSIWLDPSMTYSSAWFKSNQIQDITQAQTAKYQAILDSLQCKPSSQILEIGCGWGGFMELASKSGHAVTGLTLSHEQKKYAEERLGSLKESNPHYQVSLQDYRDCRSQFDGIASIEMFEAVGERYWPEYFKALKRCLKKDGRACIQTIVIDDQLFDRYRNNTDFIQQYIFPGGMLPSKLVFKDLALKAGLEIEKEFSFGDDYARTLCVWYDNFNHRLDLISELGFDEAFIRLWNFYLMYCAAGFKEKNIDVVQFTLKHQINNRFN
jgi:cyclopropane-fatty-acyl-phospholipid synthase